MHEIVIVEDSPAYLQTLRDMINATPELSVVACAQTMVNAEDLLAQHPQAIWLVDLGLPDGDGCDLVERCAAQATRVLVLTVFADEQHVLRALCGGANGYLTKDGDDIIKALREVGHGGSPMTPAIATYVLRKFQRRRSLPGPGFTPREAETLEALASGYTYREIATRHSVTEHTVGDHVKSIYKKLAVSSRTSAVRKAFQLGLIDLD